MPVYLIQVRSGGQHPEHKAISLNLRGMGVRTGDSVPFGYAGVVRINASKQEVFTRATLGVRGADEVTVRRIGPVTVESDQEHVHWRMTAVDAFRLRYKEGEVDIINRHQRGEIE